jgi:hypothetical protein
VKYLICSFVAFSFSLQAMQETELFPESEECFPATIWYNSYGHLCAMFGSNIIIIDKWHYPVIDDKE